MKCVLALILLCLLAACSSQDVGMSAEDQSSAERLFKAYDDLKREENWLAAEVKADELRKQFPESEAARRLNADLPHVRNEANQQFEKQRLIDLWLYQSMPVGKSEQRTAALDSRTEQVEEGEIAAIADAKLVVRDHPEWGKSIYLLLQQAKFKCGHPCAMMISFDEAAPLRFAGLQADSGQGPALFILDRPAFLSKMQQAKTVRINLPVGSGRVAALFFDVAGYDPQRFAKL